MNGPVPSCRVVLVAEDKTLRGYVRLALLHAEFEAVLMSVADLRLDSSPLRDSILVFDRSARALAVEAALLEDASLASRLIVIGAAEGEESSNTYAVLKRLDAAAIVNAVQECARAMGTAFPAASTTVELTSPPLAPASSQVKPPSSEPRKKASKTSPPKKNRSRKRR